MGKGRKRLPASMTGKETRPFISSKKLLSSPSGPPNSVCLSNRLGTEIERPLRQATDMRCLARQIQRNS
jgi:hypothetical protein